MAKRLKLATRALGAEPGRPDVPALAAWISGHRGTVADIITYQSRPVIVAATPGGDPLALYRGQVLS